MEIKVAGINAHLINGAEIYFQEINASCIYANFWNSY